MSRYELPAKNAKHTVTVGWDQPLETYFVHVVLTECDDEEAATVFWRGTNFGEIADIDTLCRVVAQYADIDDETQNKLYADAD